MASITLIAALDLQRGIGVDGDLPWKLPADLARFKRQTMGKALIMGRRTCAAIGRALPGRVSIVLSRSQHILPPGCQHAETPQQALRLAQQASAELDQDEIMVIGGAQIYRLFLQHADALELTWIQHKFVVDSFFPEFDRKQWSEQQRSERPADARNAYDLSFVRYQRGQD